MPELTLLEDNMCFGCGAKNPIGLKLEFRKDNGDYVTRFVPRTEHQGWSGITHGGILATLLDEAMVRLSWQEGLNAVTAELTVRFRRPARTGKTLEIRGRITGEEGRKVYGAAEAVGEDGRVVAEATAVMMKV